MQHIFTVDEGSAIKLLKDRGSFEKKHTRSNMKYYIFRSTARAKIIA